MEDTIFCPSCGTRVDNSGRDCPSCHEPLPAPKTVIGYGDLPAQQPVALAPAQPVAVGIAFDKTLDTVSPSPREANAQGMSPGHFEPTPEGAVIAHAPVDTPGSHTPDLPSSRMAVSVREPALVGPSAQGGSTTPGFPSGSAAPPKLAGRGTLQIDPEARPASPSAPWPVQQPSPLEPSAPIPTTGPYPPAAQASASAAATPQQSSTEPHPGPPAVAFEPLPPQPFVYGQPADGSPIEPIEGQANLIPGPDQSQSPVSEIAPTDTRKGLVWRAFSGGALLTWTLTYGLAACVFVAIHLTLCLEHGFGLMHASTRETFGVATSGLIPAILLLAASVACLTGRGWPRSLGAIAALSHVGWAGVTIYVLAQNFVLERTAAYGVVACSLSALFSVVWVTVLLAGGKWIGSSQPGKPARAVPYPLWAGPLLIVLSVLAIVHEAIRIVRVGIKMSDATRLEYAAEAVYESYPLFFASVALLFVSILLMIAGIALLRRKRWAIGLGGAAGLFLLIANSAVILVLYVWDDISNHGGPLFGLVDVFVLLAYGIAAWIALAGALRFGFLLPHYLREAPDKNADATRRKLLSVLVPTGTERTR